MGENGLEVSGRHYDFAQRIINIPKRFAADNHALTLRFWHI